MKAISLAATRSFASIAAWIALWVSAATPASAAPAAPALSEAEQVALAAYGQLWLIGTEV